MKKIDLEKELEEFNDKIEHLEHEMDVTGDFDDLTEQHLSLLISIRDIIEERIGDGDD